jgi:hypothetical protein
MDFLLVVGDLCSTNDCANSDSFSHKLKNMSKVLESRKFVRSDGCFEDDSKSLW